MTISKRDIAIVAAGVAIYFFAYCAGRSGQKSADDLKQIGARRDTVLRAIPVIVEKLRVDTIRVAAAEKKAKAAIAREDSTAATIAAIADTSSVIPTSLANLEVQQCHEMRDDLLDEIDTLKVTVRDERARGDLEHEGRVLTEVQLAKQKPPRIGFKSGVVAGVTVALAVTHPETVLKVVRAVLHLVR